MKYLKIISIYILFSNGAYAYIKKVGLSDYDVEKLKAVEFNSYNQKKIESYMKKEYSYNEEDSYTITFICDKSSKNKTNCHVQKYKILTKAAQGFKIKRKQ